VRVRKGKIHANKIKNRIIYIIVVVVVVVVAVAAAVIY
jgi:flagellar basal body-associated protein FliL